jgi:hypothetical protein
MSKYLTVKETVLTILLCLLCLMSNVWSILYLTTKDVDFYSLCSLLFILTHLILLIFMSSCLDVFARLVLARFSSHGYMSGWLFKNFLKLSPSPRHNVFTKRSEDKLLDENDARDKHTHQKLLFINKLNDKLKENLIIDLKKVKSQLFKRVMKLN